MSKSAEEIKKIGKLIYPDESNVYARPCKNGSWLFEFTNDYPLQHGKGSSCVIPQTVVDILYSYASQPEGKEDIQCKCSEEDKHGETSIMCCNECGLPTEKFWQRGPSKQQPAEKDLMQDPFIKKHLNRINLIMGSVKAKRLFVECYPTDIGATHFPNSNFAVKEIFLPDIPPSKEQPAGVEQAAEQDKMFNDIAGRARGDDFKFYEAVLSDLRATYFIIDKSGASWDAGKKENEK